ncbi:hypothetical protein GCM10017600_07400 [Streptosporangium carneum]|uniref:Uncharacterized protein n=1 Tax=Streptosporangium carneum TaxID=47481 RepID=A0A9W6HVX7_9ACTN|nr:hypothetical protein GCM10017600_07400 [Streptosporangium carneum]
MLAAAGIAVAGTKAATTRAMETMRRLSKDAPRTWGMNIRETGGVRTELARGGVLIRTTRESKSRYSFD